jgi:FAD/FMN-containing dehydrogenase
MIVFPAHMNKVLELDPKKETIIVEPGATYDKLEQTLYTHGLFLPSYPASLQYATIGGGIANNAIGEKTVKYGPTGNYVQKLRVVLANGEVIETGPLSRRELNRKLGLSSLEGHIYRELDKVLEENAALVAQSAGVTRASRSSVGYNLSKIKTKKGFDLTPLFVGSQGTLGVITEATMRVVPHNPITKLAMISFESLEDFHDALPYILALKPSICDMINKAAINEVRRINPRQLVGVMEAPNAAIHLFVEFDEQKAADQKTSIKKLAKILDRFNTYYLVADDIDDQEKIRKVRESVATILTEPHGTTKAVPVAEDIAVPVEHLVDFLNQADKIYRSVNMPPAAWGQAGEGVVRMHPMFDLAQTGDRQQLFKLADALYGAALKLGGTISASHGEGRLRAPYAVYMHGEQLQKLIGEVKKIFDPYNILNPGVKSASRDDIKSMLRSDYHQAHRNEHLPRS